MHLSFALLCDAANLSQEGKLNILGVFDALQVTQFPSVHPRANLVVRLKGTRGDSGVHHVAASWRNPQGTELWSSNGQLDIGSPPPALTELDMPLIVPCDLPLDGPGTYTMTITLDGERQAELRLHVRDAATPMPGAPMLS
ncbi:MAG TPA: hypothetical protein VMT93_01400 [Gemmatimonadaceae bacterium]|nr:hypothetical protein [Gemmatimonadaceae bacterium]